MELVMVGSLLTGLVIGAFIGIVGDRLDDGHNQRQHGDDNCSDNDTPVRDGDRSCDHRVDTQLEAEEVTSGLQNLRMALGRKEKEYLDYALDCVERIEELKKLIKDARRGANE